MNILNYEPIYIYILYWFLQVVYICFLAEKLRGLQKIRDIFHDGNMLFCISLSLFFFVLQGFYMVGYSLWNDENTNLTQYELQPDPYIFMYIFLCLAFIFLLFAKDKQYK